MRSRTRVSINTSFYNQLKTNVKVQEYLMFYVDFSVSRLVAQSSLII